MSRPTLAKSVFGAVLASTLLLTACGGDDGDTDTDAGASEPSGTLGTVETMFGTVTVPTPEDGKLDVVALGWSDAEMALSLGVVPVAVYDWQAFGADNKGVGPWATDKFGDVTPEIITNSGDALNYEQIQSLDPDLILDVRSAGDEAVYNRLKEIAPTVFAPTGSPAFATEWKTQLKSIASAVGKVTEGETVISGVQTKIDAAKTANPQFAGKTVASGTKFGDAYGAYLPGDGRFDLLSELGFVQNPPVEALTASGFFATVSVENVKALDADAAVFLPIGFTVAQTEADPLLQSLNVVKEKRSVFIDPDTGNGGAWSAASSLSIPVVIDEVVPKLGAAIK